MALIDADVMGGLLANKWQIGLGLVVLYVCYTVVYAMLFSPTARVPGSLIDKITGIRFTIHGIMGRKMYFCNDQLRKYGPLVEVAPNKLACSSSNAIKTVYGSHEWAKTSFYSDFADFQDTSSLFSEVRPHRAQILRKAFLPAFSRANLLSMSKHIFSHLEKFLHKLDEFEERREAIDTYRWFRYLTFEVITDIGFGADYDMITHGELDHPFVKDFDDSVSWGIVNVFFGPVIRVIPKGLFPASIRYWMEAPNRTDKHAQEGLDKWRAQKAEGREGHRVDILQRLIDHGEKYPDEKLSEQQLRTEIMEIMLAGGDTTASTVTYACYEMTRFPKVQQKLRAALKEAIPDPTQPITLEQLEAIPYLEWTVKEMLRMHPTIPSFLERTVPQRGAMLAGHQLKGGTQVCMSAFTQHQQTSVFPQPDVFNPERWSHETEEMRLNMLAFSTGPRSCVGQNLATVQMKIHFGMILRNFVVEAHPETTPYSMEPQDFFQGKPRSGECLLYFKRMRD